MGYERHSMYQCVGGMEGGASALDEGASVMEGSARTIACMRVRVAWMGVHAPCMMA